MIFQVFAILKYIIFLVFEQNFKLLYLKKLRFNILEFGLKKRD